MTTATEQLFRATSTVDDFPHRGRRYNGVTIQWVVDKRAVPLTDEDYRRLLVDYRDGDLYQQSIVDDYLTAEQLAALREFLGHPVEAEPVELPLPTVSPEGNGYTGHMAEAFGGDTDLYMLWETSGYPLADRIGGYYRITEDTVMAPKTEWTQAELDEEYRYTFARYYDAKWDAERRVFYDGRWDQFTTEWDEVRFLREAAQKFEQDAARCREAAREVEVRIDSRKTIRPVGSPDPVPDLELREVSVATHHGCPICGQDTRESEGGLDVYPVGDDFCVCPTCAQRYRPDLYAKAVESWRQVDEATA